MLSQNIFIPPGHFNLLIPSRTNGKATARLLSKNKQLMKEDFLHYVWRLKKFDVLDLKTTEGESIQIVMAGEHNKNAGPDFINARIRIGETLWAGNVEMHLKASEWRQHRHQEDRAYDNVILHVVLEEDELVRRASGERIPCLILRERISYQLATQYLRMQQNEDWIPCQRQFMEVDEVIRDLWLDRLMVERLEQRTAEISTTLQENQNNWEESFYHFLARNFGLKVNVIAFEALARSLPLSILAKHKNCALQIEALLFGQAGMLDCDFTESYPQKLRKEYLFLQKKYKLHPIRVVNWKFSRLRPANFPTIRIAQFAQFILQSNHLFSKILEVENASEIQAMFDVKTSSYWNRHYVFERPSIDQEKRLGKTTIDLLIINSIAPFLFLYGKSRTQEHYQDRALQLLENLPAEKNKIIQEWKKLGMKPNSAYQTQALLQLKNQYCQQKQCLQCTIGNAILKQSDF